MHTPLKVGTTRAEKKQSSKGVGGGLTETYRGEEQRKDGGRTQNSRTSGKGKKALRKKKRVWEWKSIY